MSGNNYDDILDTLDTADVQTVKKLVHFMSEYRPQVEINRVFQRKLKKELLQKVSKKGFAWQFQFSYLSILATSFILVFGIWKMWGINISLPQNTGGDTQKSIVSSNMKGVEYNGISEENTTSNQALSMTEAIPVLSEKGANSETIGGENPSPKVMGSKALAKSSIPKAPENTTVMNLSDEIANISNDINAIVDSSENQTPMLMDAGASTAKMNTLATQASSPVQSVLITIDYPNRMVIYKKTEPWTTSELEKRTGSGMTKSLEKTIAKGDLGNILMNKGNITDMTLEYKGAQRNGDSSFYLIPCLKYKNIDGNYSFSPLVTGYALD